MQKWGKNRNGTTRFRCRNCRTSTTRRRLDLSQKYKQQLFQRWLLSKLELSSYAQKYGVTRQTLHHWFKPFWLQEPTPRLVNIRDQVLIVDGKYIERNATVLIACTPKQVVYWSFTQRENSSSWTLFLASMRHIPFAIVCDGQRGMLKAIKTSFPSVVVQRCQFHVIQYCLSRITLKPEIEAAQALRDIVVQISHVKTKDHLRVWLGKYIEWRKTYHDFLQERTYQDYVLTPTGRKKWHYTHSRLHAAHSHLKNALPNLFKYLLYPQIPNTTNFVEGAINSPMQETLRNHRGFTLSQRRVLIAHFLNLKQ